MKIALGSDHAGYELKEKLKKAFPHKWDDVGTLDESSVDYPDFAAKVCEKVLNKECDRGVLICGSGIGMSIAANRFKGIRAALCHNVEFARLSRDHNDANILCLPARFVSFEEAQAIVKTWIETPFSNGERHIKRVQKLG